MVRLQNLNSGDFLFLKKFNKLIMRVFHLSIFLFVFFSVNLLGQSTFYKHLGTTPFQGGGGYSHDKVIGSPGDRLSIQQGVGRSYQPVIITYDKNGNHQRYYYPKDSLLDDVDYYWDRFRSGPFPTESGIIASYQWGFNWGAKNNIVFTMHYDSARKHLWKLDSIYLFNATHNNQYGTIAYGRHFPGTSGFYRIRNNGEIAFKKSFNSAFNISSVNGQSAWLKTDGFSSFIINNDGKDSVQIVEVDTIGNVISNQLITGRRIIAIEKNKMNWFFIEKKSDSLQLTITDNNFNSVNSYQFNEGYKLNLQKMVVKDDLITVLLENDVTNLDFDNNFINEFRVISTSGEYVKRRYYKIDSMPNPQFHRKNHIFTIDGFGMTNDGGCYMSIFVSVDGAWSNFHALIKTDENFRTNYYLNTFRGYVDLNAWDSVLVSPVDTTDTLLIENSPKYSGDLKVYPIPAKERLHIDAGDEIFTEFEIYNLTGAIQTQGKVKENSIDVSNLKGGSYILQIRNTNEIFRKKIFIE